MFPEATQQRPPLVWFDDFVRRYLLGKDHPFKLRILRFLFRGFGIRLRVPFSRGALISLDPFDGVQSTILRSGYYEPEVWEALEDRLVENEVFWDVGANIGSVSLRAGLCSKVTQVHCFEPSPTNFSVVKLNAKLNPQLPLVLHQIGLSDREEVLRLTQGPPENSGATKLERTPRPLGLFSVKCKTVDQVIQEGLAPAPTCLKIDVEGMEMQVLRGAEQLFATNPPKALVVEAPSTECGDLNHPELGHFLTSRGYQMKRLNRVYGKIESVENFLFFLDVAPTEATT